MKLSMLSILLLLFPQEILVHAFSGSILTLETLVSSARVFSDFQPELATEERTTTVVLIKSSVSHFNRRQAVRDTWSCESCLSPSFASVFVLGHSSDPLVMAFVREEQSTYRDLLMGDFEDTYYNLTLKTVFALTWMRSHHPSKWLLYVDDDAVVNLSSLGRFVSDLQAESRGCNQQRMYCYSQQHAPVSRDVDSKWFVGPEVYPNEHYPAYCSGLATLMPPSVVARLRDASLHPETQPKLWIDDVFVTGIASAAANVSIVSSPLFDAAFHASVCQVERFSNKIAVGQFDSEEIRHFWSQVHPRHSLARVRTSLLCRLMDSSANRILAFLLACNVVAFLVLLSFLWRSRCLGFSSPLCLPFLRRNRGD